MNLTPGVNFINVLRTTFVLVVPESVKNTVKSSVSFYAFGIYECKSCTQNVDEFEPRSQTFFLLISRLSPFILKLENEVDAKPIIDSLLSKSSDINARDNEDNTPLHIAAKYNKRIIMEYLVLTFNILTLSKLKDIAVLNFFLTSSMLLIFGTFNIKNIDEKD